MHAAAATNRSDRSWVGELGMRPGLCGSCRHARPARSPRSTFVRCALADRDPAFPRYPALPVERCAGFLSLDGEGD
jgi:hypothetical protein